MEEKDLEAMFIYLDALRDSGITNMYGAIPYLMDTFGLDKETASEVLTKWLYKDR